MIAAIDRGEFLSTRENLLAHLQRWLADHSTPAILLLNGPLGVGKTSLVEIFRDLISPTDRESNPVASPTYALHHRYGRIEHFDLYRLENEDELETFGFWEMLQDPQNWCLIEWSERVADTHWPRNRPVFQWDLSWVAGNESERRYQWVKI